MTAEQTPKIETILNDLGLDSEPPPDPFGKALWGYATPPEDFTPTYADHKPVSAASSFHPGIAAILSFMVPGAGQIYGLRIMSGIAWLVAVVICYLLFLPLGLIAHVLCIVAATQD